MLARKQQLITYETITIYEKNYKFPVLKNPKFKKIQKKIKNCQTSIKEGVKSHSYVWGLIKRKQDISQKEIFAEVQLLIKDYTQLLDFVENYKDSYQDFLLKFIDDWKKLFNQKYVEIRKINEERNKLEIKNKNNLQIIEKLRWEKQENLKSISLLSNTNLLILEKVKLLSEGIKNLAEDTKNQKQAIQQIVKDIEVYQEIYEYQLRATKIRQEIAIIAETVINIEKSLQDYFNPFQSLIDEVVKLDANFYATVGEIQNLASSTLNSQANLLTIQDNTVSHNLMNLLVASYEKKDRLQDAFFQTQLLNFSINDLDLSQDEMTVNQAICLISNYMSTQLAAQKKVLGIVDTDVIYTDSQPTFEKIELPELPSANNDIEFPQEVNSNKNIDYSELQNLLANSKWQEADIETAKLMLQIIGKYYWNEVYKEDIINFSCQDFYKIDQLWQQYSHGYFGFSVQQSIWNELGGQDDYETQKRLGDRLGWRKDEKWLNYSQLTFKFSPTTPMGHLPVKWLHYDEEICGISPNSYTEPQSMGAWRVDSWLVWQMHLFFTRAKWCLACK